MRRRWHQSILARTGLVLLGVLLLLGAITVSINLQYTRLHAEQATQLRLGQLLDTVESTASIACFTKDDVLARELISGLLRNSEVLSVTVQADGERLASLTRPRDDAPSAPKSGVQPLVREILSPFPPRTKVGRVLLTPNQAVIDEALRRETRLVLLQVVMQLLLAALAFATVTLVQIIRPIESISSRLHQMDAAGGERLRPPPRHHGSEIGLLVTDVNRLADRLVETLEEERTLRIQREIDEQRYHAIFENAETGLFVIDDQGHLISWNPAFARLVRLPVQDELPAQRSIFDLDWEEPARLAELLLGCMSEGRGGSKDLRYDPSDGAACWLSMVLTPLADRSIQGVIHDVTQHLEAERSAKRLAVTDRLTGVANQLGLEQRARELAKTCDLAKSGGFALVLISLDNFKRISEGLDPSFSDSLLKETTKRLSSCIKGTDVLARLGRSQFGLLLVGLDRALETERVTERILRASRQPVFVAGSPMKLQVSAGIALYPHDTDGGIAKLMQHADLALSSAESGSGSRMCFFDPDLARLAEDRHRLENDLRRAIHEPQLVLFFQPIVDLAQGRLVGAESLIRWRHPERGLVPPDAFIPLAEETGLIGDMGLWVLESAGQQLAAWRSQGLDLYLSVNVSATQIPDALPPDLLLDLAHRLGFAPGSLALEITEGVLISDVGGAQSWLDTVRAAGFPVYLDDFGTGYASLSYLKRFTVDRLKVDKSFVRDIGINQGDRALVEAVAAMARSFGIDVIAEGIEDPSQLRLLRAMGCRYGQGYFFSPPVPIDSFPEAGARIPTLLEPLLTAESDG